MVDVEVDTDTGKVKILRCTVAQDAGRAIHPSYVERQMQGGTAQGVTSWDRLMLGFYTLLVSPKRLRKTTALSWRDFGTKAIWNGRYDVAFAHSQGVTLTAGRSRRR
jgi:hypothetical protein